MKSDAFATEDDSLGHLLVEGCQREDMLVLALQECQAVVDSGKPIDHDGILAKYPGIRDELSACLEGMALMQSATPGTDGDSSSLGAIAVQSHLSPSATLGDFRIERELGRGGMGVVYQAEQLSVGRKVALKVLPYASMLDKRQVARFQNEARAAATLEHPHIVPVYFVGNERGVYYYAMRLIDGKNLAEVMKELRSARPGNAGSTPASLSRIASQLTSSPRKQASSGRDDDLANSETIRDEAADTVPEIISGDGTRAKVYHQPIARLGKQAAEALDFAHSHGIIHRDIKPANIMLDEVGDAWITDFGLARIEADNGMTMSGDLVGTLRYMSPEQTLAKRITVDHRCDVYSLGATLYELLTLRPIYEADDRASLLKQIAFEDPVKPSKLDSAIPYDLETVLLKALNKNPDDRYESAAAMASDLDRYLSHQPVLARRTPVVQRIRMWSRRHPTIVAASTLVIFAICASLATAGMIVASKERNTRLRVSVALDAKADALNQSNKNLKIARQNLQIALTAVNELNRDVASTWIASDRDLTATQVNFLNQSAKIFSDIASQFGNDPNFRFAAGTAYINSAAASQRIAKFSEAETKYSKAVSLLSEEVESGANSEEVRSKLALALLNLGDLRVKSGRVQSAPEAYAAASDIYQQLRIDQAEDVEYGLLLVHAKQGLSHLALMMQDAEGAIQISREIIDELEAIGAANEAFQEKALGRQVLTVLEMVQAFRVLKRIPEAEKTGSEFLNRARRLLRNKRDDRALEIQLAAIQSEVAQCQIERGASVEAKKNLIEALARTKATFLFDGTPMEFMVQAMSGKVSDDQMSPMAFTQYAEIQSKLARVLLNTGTDVEGFVQVDEALRVLYYFDDIYPESIEFLGAASNAVKVYAKINLNVPAFKEGAEVLIRGKRTQADLKREQRDLVNDIYGKLRDKAIESPRQFLAVACDVGADLANIFNKAREHEKAVEIASGTVLLIEDAAENNADVDVVWIHDLRTKFQAFRQRIETLNLEDPQDANTFAQRASLSSMEGDEGGALEDYKRAIDMEPDHAFALNAAAWILATNPDPDLRDGQRAVEYAARVCEASGWEECNILDTLAAGYAELGDFDAAVKWQNKATKLAPDPSKADFGSRLELYQSGQPYHVAM